MLATYHKTTAGQQMSAVRAARDAPPPKKLTTKQTLALQATVRKARPILAHSWRKFERSMRRYMRARTTAGWTRTVRYESVRDCFYYSHCHISNFRPVPYPEQSAEEDRYRQWERQHGTAEPPASLSSSRAPSVSASSLTSTLSRMSFDSLKATLKHHIKKKKDKRVLAAESDKHSQHSLSDPGLLDRTERRLHKWLTDLVDETLLYFEQKELLDYQM
jgi:hypothetical protein